MISHDNPFRQFRAEQIGSDLWKLFVPGPFKNLLTPRPLIIEGGRGSGKTMFFLYNSWKERLLSLKGEGKSFGELLKPPESIGIYYKVDTAFVTSMEGKGRSDWEGVFSTYLGVSLVKEFLNFLVVAVQSGLVEHNDLTQALSQLRILLKGNEDINNLDSAFKICDDVLDGVELILNEPEAEPAFRPTIIGRLVLRFVEKIKSLEIFCDSVFRIYIDEYETLLEYQQRLINTLIKHSNHFLIYNIGMRPKGMITQKTKSETEIVQGPHDYNLFRPELALDPEGENTRSIYYDLLREICRLRFKKLNLSMNLNFEEEIEYYLGRYRVDDEIQVIVNMKPRPPFLDRLKEIIRELEPNSQKAEEYIVELGETVPPLNARLHLCLLLRTPHYRPELDYLKSEYNSWLKGESGTYDDWLHNTKMGLAFLLANEYRKSKSYYGFDVFAMISSGVIRYFLELCEQSFDFAMLDGFAWDNTRPITPEEQSKAARYVSRYKIKDIEGYEPFGRFLRIFVENIGEVFGEFHRNPNVTLGEPEINHFYTDTFALNDSTRRVLNSAIMWAVLQERTPTKEKATELPVEFVDYHLNHIYCPYFEISYRQKRKLFIKPDQLTTLLSGDERNAKMAARELVSARLGRKRTAPDLTSLEQIRLFGDI